MVGVLNTLVWLFLAIFLVSQSGLVELSLIVFFTSSHVYLIVVMLVLT